MQKADKLDILTAIYVFCVVSSQLMGAKTFTLFSIGDFTLNQSVSIFTVPLVFTINDMITEVYGRARTRSIIRAGLITVALCLLFALIATSLPASQRFLENEPSYDLIFGLSARFSLAGLIAFAVSEFTDLFVYVHIRQALGSRALWLRNNASNMVAQLIDTGMFMVLAFYNPALTLSENSVFILSLMIPYWLVKSAMSILETPFVYLGVRWLRGSQTLST